MTRTFQHMHRHALPPPSLTQSHRPDGSQGAPAGTATHFGSGEHEFKTRHKSRYCWGGRLINVRVRERSLYRLSIRTWVLVVPPFQIQLLCSYYSKTVYKHNNSSWNKNIIRCARLHVSACYQSHPQAYRVQIKIYKSVYINGIPLFYKYTVYNNREYSHIK
jgi:hypothetical protein